MRTKRRTLTHVDDDTAVYRAFKAAQKPRVELTLEQRAKRHWSNMQARVRSEHYAKQGIEIKWAYADFLSWYCSEKNTSRVEAILNAKETPSIDRVSSTGHYEPSNCRIIPTSVNRALGEVNALVSRMRTLQVFLKENEHWLKVDQPSC